MNDAIDRFLALSVRRAVRGKAPPPWSEDWPSDAEFHAAVADRAAFHGVALALLGAPGALEDWPGAVADRVREEARGQSFWELGHRTVAARLIAALAAAGTPAVLTKGTALAYSAYPDPAMRRRGDSDLLLRPADRKAARAALVASGFRRVGDARPLQESWATECDMGFAHQFDLHWRISASALIAQKLEAGGVGSRSLPLPRLSEAARGVPPTDNIILIAINRALHHKYGYRSGADKAFEQDRLIWALDLALLCEAFTPADWEALRTTAAATGTAPLVLSLLDASAAMMGTSVPPDLRAGLAEDSGDAALLACIAPLPSITRLRLDLSASTSLAEKLRVFSYALLPGPEVLHERFPEAAHWPTALLQGRRLVFGLGRMLTGRA
ncbi:nucleotidyltransferase family protein [Erythrobacter donghaensis]|uniref:nucleotidyltransferase family protein n=1 Tax=Erythrobacter donghaensis TaxID=267135 RepID=UPI000A37B0BE|nr:nucleotidyltransferase family protein [Erythrobacter donghaensis]